MKIGILLDSSATPSPEIFKNTNVEIIPLHINLAGGEDFLDTLENCEKYRVLDSIQEGKDLKTSQASPGEVEQKYNEMLKKYNHVFHIPITNNLSSMLQTAMVVSKDEKFEGKVTVFMNEDITATIIEKAALIMNEKIVSGEFTNVNQLNDFLTDYCKNSAVLFVPGDLKRLNAGGRTKKMLASVLSLIKMKVMLRWGASPTKEGIVRTYSSIIEKAIEIFKNEFNDEFYFMFLRSDRLADKHKEVIRNALDSAKIQFEERTLPSIYMVHAGIESTAFLICRKNNILT